MIDILPRGASMIWEIVFFVICAFVFQNEGDLARMGFSIGFASCLAMFEVINIINRRKANVGHARNGPDGTHEDHLDTGQ
jgi:hypothetical protein